MKAIKLQLNKARLSGPLYETGSSKPPRTITTTALQISSDIIELLEDITEEYVKYANIPKIPVRIDLGITEKEQLILFEINTGFVDQFGSGLNILECLGQKEQFETALKILSRNRKRSKIVVSCPEYMEEVKLMIKYLKQEGKEMQIISEEDAISSKEEIFCYGYPTQNMIGKDNIVPGGIGLELESKWMFYEFLDQWLQQDKNEKYKKYVENLERYNQKKQPYSKLPKDRDLIFKKDGPKIKGDRETVGFAKANPGNQSENEYLYTFGQKIAQEPFNPMILNGGIDIIEKMLCGSISTKTIEKCTAEIRALLLPNKEGCFDFIVAYLLLGGLPENRSLVNDSCPQGAVILE